MDRIDMHVRVERVDPAVILSMPEAEPSARVAARVARAWEQASGRASKPNTRLSGTALLKACKLTPEARDRLALVARTKHLSGRAVTRMLRVARTIADLAGTPRVEVEHVSEALAYRQMGRS
jgi:magnesium chelatase family protein